MNIEQPCYKYLYSDWVIACLIKILLNKNIQYYSWLHNTVAVYDIKSSIGITVRPAADLVIFLESWQEYEQSKLQSQLDCDIIQEAARFTYHAYGKDITRQLEQLRYTSTHTHDTDAGFFKQSHILSETSSTYKV